MLTIAGMLKVRHTLLIESSVSRTATAHDNIARHEQTRLTRGHQARCIQDRQTAAIGKVHGRACEEQYADVDETLNLMSRRSVAIHRGGKIYWTSGSSQLENSGNALVPPHRRIGVY
ncbi:hypothetical protein [Paraburkholderia caffeinilytica]|uniref:hypothetical protein n=1 Tax=Paraburkholderia caffeinilytica TaxID=1761016 RepID=UPI003D9FB796